jgi:DNA mismatch endonuclease (patch repair protein)
LAGGCQGSRGYCAPTGAGARNARTSQGNSRRCRRREHTVCSYSMSSWAQSRSEIQGLPTQKARSAPARARSPERPELRRGPPNSLHRGLCGTLPSRDASPSGPGSGAAHSGSVRTCPSRVRPFGLQIAGLRARARVGRADSCRSRMALRAALRARPGRASAILCVHGGRRRVDTRTPEKRSEIMAAVRSKNTGPELAVRRLAFRLGYRFRLHGAHLPGRPDLVFSSRRCAIFVHGCFWHGHGCSKGRLPKSRRDYWRPKIAANRKRDQRNVEQLHANDWRSLVVWQCELRNPQRLARRILRFLSSPTGVRKQGREKNGK